MMPTIPEAAAMLARAAHAGQYRRFSEEPYWRHPERVARAVANHPGSTPVMHVAAWLHDVLEEGYVSLREIRETFGPMVAEIVWELTKPPRAHGSRSERNAVELQRLHRISRAAKIIKLYDRLDNLRDLPPQDSFTKTYAEETLFLVEVLRDGDSILSSEVAARARELLGLKT